MTAPAKQDSFEVTRGHGCVPDDHLYPEQPARLRRGAPAFQRSLPRHRRPAVGKPQSAARRCASENALPPVSFAPEGRSNWLVGAKIGANMRRRTRKPRIAGAPRRLPLEQTTDLGAINDRRILVLLDEQNLSLGARDLGFRLDYDKLARRIRAATRHADLHLVTAAEADDTRPRRRFEALGYTVHVKLIRRVPLPNGHRRCDSNADNLFAFQTGLLLANGGTDAVVFGSGDYGLSGELAHALAGRKGRKVVMTLSLPESTSQDLDSRKNHHITANLEIGLDVMEPVSGSAHRPGA